MNNIFKVLIAGFGILIIFSTLSLGMGPEHSSFNFFAGLALGGGLIFSPFIALSMFLQYLLMVMCIVGFPILGAYIGVQLGGKDSFIMWIGAICGGIAGFKFVISEMFQTLMSPLQTMANHDKK